MILLEDKMQLLWLCLAICAAGFSSTDARYAPRNHLERGRRQYQSVHHGHKGGHRILGAGVVPIKPEDIGEGIVPEVTEAVYQYVPKDQTEEPSFWDSAWDNVLSGVNDIGDTLGDVASDVGETVGDWGSEVGESVGNWGENVGETLDNWGDNVGETLNEFGENVGNTVDDWGETLADVAEDLKDQIGGALNDTQYKVQEAQVALVAAAKYAGSRLRQTYVDAKEGIPTLKTQILDSLKRFGLLVTDGANYVFTKLTLITDKIHSSAIIEKLQEKLEQGDEQVAEFLQLVGYKMEEWFQSHTQVTQHPDIFQDPEIQVELQLLVEHGILTANDVNILVGTSEVSSKLSQLMERGSESVTEFVQLLNQKIVRWYEANGGSISQFTQQVPSFFQDQDIQEELNKLVEQEILTRNDIKLLIESTPVISKLQDAVERGDERVTQIFVLMNDRREELQSQQIQRNVESMPDIFQDDDVQDELQNLVDAGTLTQDDFYVITQQQSQKGHINIQKRLYNRRGWFDSVGDTLSDWGDTISDTASDVGVAVSDLGRDVAASDVGVAVSDWGSNVADVAVDVAGDTKDWVVDAAGDVNDAVSGAFQKRNLEATLEDTASNDADQMVNVAGDVKDADDLQKRKRLYNRRGWFDSVGDTLSDWGDTISDTASDVGVAVSDLGRDVAASDVGVAVSDWGSNVADVAVDVAGDTKDWVVDAAGDVNDAVSDAFQKRNLEATLEDTASNVAHDVVDVDGDLKDSAVLQKRNRIHSRRGLFDSVGDSLSDWGNTLSDTASDVGVAVSDWGNNVADVAVDVAGDTKDWVVDAAGDVNDAVSGAFIKRNLEATLEDNVSNDADQMVDVAGDVKDADALQKREYSPDNLSPKVKRMLRSWLKSLQQ